MTRLRSLMAIDHGHPENRRMTIDKSLKIRRGGMGNRNVLTRVERIQKLEENERWREGDPLMGLPKVRVQKVTLKKKKKVKKEEEEGEATEAAPAAT